MSPSNRLRNSARPFIDGRTWAIQQATAFFSSSSESSGERIETSQATAYGPCFVLAILILWGYPIIDRCEPLGSQGSIPLGEGSNCRRDNCREVD